jgi:hypothetical protein
MSGVKNQEDQASLAWFMAFTWPLSLPIWSIALFVKGAQKLGKWLGTRPVHKGNLTHDGHGWTFRAGNKGSLADASPAALARLEELERELNQLLNEDNT